MKILHVVHGLPRGGLENGVVNLVNGLPRPEFDQAICCLDLRGEMAARVDPAVPIYVLERGRHDLRLPFKLAHLMRTLRPELIHCRNWNSWADTVIAWLLAGRPGRLIWSFHGFADGHGFPRRRLVASRALASLTHQLLAVCRDSATRYAHLAGIPLGRFAVIYNGVDTQGFRPLRSSPAAPHEGPTTSERAALRAALSLPADSVLLITVASLTPVKNHLGLLDAIAAHRQAQSTSRARFLFVGTGALRGTLERRIADLGLDSQVLLQGPSDQVPELLAAADAFILPSSLEGMSNAILEAMASGLPVIALRVGGNPELVQDGVTGLLCDPGDGAGLAAAIDRLTRDEQYRQALGQAARQRAETEFSLAMMIRRYADLYRRLAKPGLARVVVADA